VPPGLHLLLDSLVDYAGLFPPARLPLDQVIRNYLGYLAETEAWMLGRLICPAERLRELADQHHELFSQGPRFGLAVLGRGGATKEELLARLEADRADLDAFLSHRGTAYVEVDVLEVRLPAALVQDPVQCDEILTELARTGLQVFVEAPASPEFLARLKQHGTRFGCKLRTGGLEAAAFPPAEQVAQVLAHCLAAGVPLKATAGLHHPLPYRDATLGVRQHGFVNLFVAGILGHVHRLEVETLRRILEDEEASHFRFDADGLRWQEWTASCDQIRLARREAILSFGSCSFDEPRQDLRQLGWL
jgi:hypothetical protein